MTNTEQEILKEFEEKISDHAFDGFCTYNDTEHGKGHADCRYPYNPGRNNPKGAQCLKKREEHFDILSALARVRKECLEEVIGDVYSAKKQDDVRKGGGQYGHPETDFNTGYNQAISDILLLLNKN